MIFYALKDGERVYVLDMPEDDGPVHLPDLAKLGVTDFQARHPDISLREHDILFGFEHARYESEAPLITSDQTSP